MLAEFGEFSCVFARSHLFSLGCIWFHLAICFILIWFGFTRFRLISLGISRFEAKYKKTGVTNLISHKKAQISRSLAAGHSSVSSLKGNQLVSYSSIPPLSACLKKLANALCSKIPKTLKELKLCIGKDLIQ